MRRTHGIATSGTTTTASDRHYGDRHHDHRHYGDRHHARNRRAPKCIRGDEMLVWGRYPRVSLIPHIYISRIGQVSHPERNGARLVRFRTSSHRYSSQTRTVTPNAHRYARGRRDRDSGPKQYDTALDQIVERLGVSGDRYDAAGMRAVGR